MSLVNVHNEWDPLEEIIVGTAAGARVSRPDLGLFAIEYAAWGSPEAIPSGPFPADLLAKTEDELDALSAALEDLGVKVRRPVPRDHASTVSTPDWETDGFYDYCPRDGTLVVGDMLIETPMVLRSRFLETLAYKPHFIEMARSGPGGSLRRSRSCSTRCTTSTLPRATGCASSSRASTPPTC
jgi:scyllo-inosamine-4-phosphate amidinotransferase 1